MEFDKSRVFSAVNADELHEGDKVIVADDLDTLKHCVKDDSPIDTIRIIGEEDYLFRFGVKGNCVTFALAYLVERKANCTNCGMKSECKDADIENPELHNCLMWEKPKNENCTNCGNRMTCIKQKTEHPELTKCGDYKRYECSEYKQKAEKHTDYNHCEEAKKAYYCAMTNACPNKHYRPFRDTDELIKVWREKSKQVHSDYSLTMPYIWVRRKEANSKGQLITEFGDGWGVGVGRGEAYNMTDLLVYFTFLDGSVCGVEE